MLFRIIDHIDKTLKPPAHITKRFTVLLFVIFSFEENINTKKPRSLLCIVAAGTLIVCICIYIYIYIYIDRYFMQNVYLQYFNIIEHIKNNTYLYIHICTHICREKKNKKNTWNAHSRWPQRQGLWPQFEVVATCIPYIISSALYHRSHGLHRFSHNRANTFISAANSVNISKHLDISVWLASWKCILISSSWYCYPETTIGLGQCT